LPADDASIISGTASFQSEGEFWQATEVVDGDTLHVVGPGGELKVRVLGINTPESGECFSSESANALEGLVADTDLVLVTDQTDLDQFERALRYVETADGVDVGAALVAGGYAISRRYEPDVARDALYSDLQATAQSDRVGLWAPDACGSPVVEGEVIEVEVNSDAPGDDSENLNGEWIRFTSVADKPIELDGWQVADESASHRYSFDEVVLNTGRSVTLYTGCGVDSEIEVFWCEGSGPVWNNGGDTVFLRDPSGNLVAVFAYGESS
jgi:micrococcal nuclease